MKKKILALAIAAIMVVTALASVSLAYLMDSDYDKNTMTVGHVKIVQNETKRDGTAYEDNLKLLPAVYPTGALSKDLTIADTNGANINVWGDSINNEIDKFVSVTNTGSEEAYIRTIIAFETQRHYAPNTDTLVADLWDLYLLINGSFDFIDRYVTIDDVEYAICAYTYKGVSGDGKIQPKETTESSLRQIALSPDAGNEFFQYIGEKYDILVLSQAVQTAGFENADQALNAAFGDLTTVEDSKLIEWLSGTTAKTTADANTIAAN